MEPLRPRIGDGLERSAQGKSTHPLAVVPYVVVRPHSGGRCDPHPLGAPRPSSRRFALERGGKASAPGLDYAACKWPRFSTAPPPRIVKPSCGVKSRPNFHPATEPRADLQPRGSGPRQHAHRKRRNSSTTRDTDTPGYSLTLRAQVAHRLTHTTHQPNGGGAGAPLRNAIER